MKRITKLDVLPFAYTVTMVYVIIGLIFGIIITGMSLLFGGAASTAGGGDMGMTILGGSAVFGVGAIILMPIFYGIAGFIGGLIFALVYNLSAKVTGGIALTLEDEAGSTSTQTNSPSSAGEPSGMDDRENV